MTTGGSAYLIDTNILIYAYDTAEPAKRTRAWEVLRHVRRERTGVLSVQILNEFYSNVTRKLLYPLTVEQARVTAVRFCRSWQILDLTDRTFLDAAGAVSQYQMSFWDALIWGTANQHEVPYVITEDQEHGRLIGPICYLNPYHPNFDLAQLS